MTIIHLCIECQYYSFPVPFFLHLVFLYLWEICPEREMCQCMQLLQSLFWLKYIYTSVTVFANDNDESFYFCFGRLAHNFSLFKVFCVDDVHLNYSSIKAITWSVWAMACWTVRSLYMATICYGSKVRFIYVYLFFIWFEVCVQNCLCSCWLHLTSGGYISF